MNQDSSRKLKTFNYVKLSNYITGLNLLQKYVALSSCTDYGVWKNNLTVTAFLRCGL